MCRYRTSLFLFPEGCLHYQKTISSLMNITVNDLMSVCCLRVSSFLINVFFHSSLHSQQNILPQEQQTKSRIMLLFSPYSLEAFLGVFCFPLFIFPACLLHVSFVPFHNYFQRKRRRMSSLSLSLVLYSLFQFLVFA